MEEKFQLSNVTHVLTIEAEAQMFLIFWYFKNMINKMILFEESSLKILKTNDVS